MIRFKALAKIGLTVAVLFFGANFQLGGNPMLIFTIFCYFTASFSSFERHYTPQAQFPAIFTTLHCQESLHVSSIPPPIGGASAYIKVVGLLFCTLFYAVTHFYLSHLFAYVIIRLECEK